MSFRVAEPVKSKVDGRVYWSWIVTESSSLVGDEWNIGGLPVFFTITLFEAEWVGATTGQTISPELGLKTSWLLNSLDAVAQNDRGAASIRTPADLRVTAWDRSLFGRSKPTSTAGSIVTRITIREGH